MLKMKKLGLMSLALASIGSALAGYVSIPVVYNTYSQCESARASKAREAGVVSTTSCAPYERTGKYYFTYTIYQP